VPHFWLPLPLPTYNRSTILSPGAFGPPLANAALTFEILFVSTEHHFRSPLLEYLYRSTLSLLDYMMGCIQRSSANISRTVSRQMSRGCILKHEYANLARLAISQPSYLYYSTLFVFCAYPTHYTVIYAIGISGPCIFKNIIISWVSIATWYDLELPISYNGYPTTSLTISESIHSLSHWYGCTCQAGMFHTTPNFIAGGKFQLTYKHLGPYIVTGCSSVQDDDTLYRFVSHIPYQTAMDLAKDNKTVIVCRIPLDAVSNHLTLGQAKSIAKMHGVFVARRAPLATIVNALVEHQCYRHCYDYVYVFNQALSRSEQKNDWYDGLGKAKRKSERRKTKVVHNQTLKQAAFKTRRSKENKNTYSNNKKQHKFPPMPPTDKLVHKIITGFCRDTHPSQFQEAGCAVCGILNPTKDLLKLDTVKCSMTPLVRSGIMAVERKDESEDIDISTKAEPVLDYDCHSLCNPCHKHLVKGNCPPMALANGLWLGKVPLELRGLSFVEKLLISRIRHNRCIVKVAAGRYKMRANAISFQNPIPKVYDVLPPPLEELDQVLACIFTGPCQPTQKDIERTPLLVRRIQVGKALQWLKLNHVDYKDTEISNSNLDKYPLNGTPVVIDYRESILNKDKEAMSVHDSEEEEGVESGDCSFVVHGLTGEEFSEMTLETIKAKALEHLMKDGKIMFVGHASQPESIYKNSQLFPSMMPWLFPYGLGGICNNLHQGPMSTIAHKRHLLMYHDKRFQMDPGFALIALNHEQIQESTTGGYLIAEKSSFSEITDRLHNIDLNVLSDISTRLSQNIRVKPETKAEKLCYKLMNDLETVGGHVKGSATSKKYMRNEIWSLISYLGAPSWFITLSPADSKHPICLYYADTNEEFKPDVRLPDEAFRLVANNPVAAARFFDLMCQAFIKNVLGVGNRHKGIFGKTSAYYGTVEQQGRLTLHLHTLVWLKNSLSPQEIRNRIMDKTSDFQRKIVEYLEAVHKGEFFNGQLHDVNQRVKEEQKNDSEYLDPTKTMPESPPELCQEKECSCCEKCSNINSWWIKFRRTVDDLVMRSNGHSCRMSTKDQDGNDIRKGCLNKQNKCKARFPREIVKQTMVDPLTGALKVKKGEPWLNSFTPTITYLFRCNTDTTSLLSGTAIKAIVAYVSDYVTKPGLKTYSVFDTIRRVFDRNSELMNGSSDRKSSARQLMTKIVNALTAKMEMGSPMASMYLLGNPDHYTGHKFVNFYWRSYVQEANAAWELPKEDEKPAKIVLNKSLGKYVGLSNVQDYIQRPVIYNDLNLYDWIKRSKKSKRSKSQQVEFNDKIEDASKYNPEILDDEVDELDILAECRHAGGGIKTSDFSDDDSLDGPSENNTTETEDELNIGDEDAQYMYEDEHIKHDFLKTHPQFKTHHVYCIDKDNVVPNFLGGSLPRRDQGDREYYCLTMLTLFKPWRFGKDLKCTDYTWDETFVQHIFTMRQKSLMDNFNLRYECNDARDDYYAKMKKDEDEQSFFPLWASSNVLKDLDNNTFAEYDDDSPVDIVEESVYLNPSSKHLDKLQEMNSIENVVQNAGWLDPCPQTIDPINSKGLKVQVNISGSKWSSLVKAAKDIVLGDRKKHLPVNEERHITTQNCNNVIVDNISYLRKHFKAEQADKQDIINSTVKDFMLNKEQERAFRIVANHATMSQPSSLKMYLGGMGGTGKSQVIKALIAFFEKRNEAHRIITVAPTGSAAALLNGSTYHSVLGIRSVNKKGEVFGNEQAIIAQVKGKLDGVDYIFLDEVSMVACHDFYKISAQLCKARNVTDIPFGGVNMIFAGDFAQLAPVGGQSLYQNNVGTSIDASQTLKGQQAAIGKALWHQITTVVILRENMRQKVQSMEDAKLRTALENMRYAACTLEDIAFLRSRIAGKRPGQPKLADKKFRNVSIITAFNASKDRINKLGSERFAKETGQTLTDFYSVDHFGEEENPALETKRMKKKRTLNSGEIDPVLRNVLWNLRHSASDHIPGKLSLCIGMPIMIRNNEATELCITKGQEGHVAGWQSAIGPHGQLMLDTLFVKLDQPAKTIKIKDLPDNIVPLTKIPSSILCVTPSELALRISRSQIPVLPNFAMTDYASQGKTRFINVIDLSSCRDHLSYYTCLSRGSTAEGTVIIQGFSEYKIMCGASGYLRQEFRELELLDEITKLAYDNELPKHVNGNLRNALIRQFQLYKGTDHMPPDIPKQLIWTLSDPMDLLPVVTDSPWQLIKDNSEKKKTSKNANAATTQTAVRSNVNVSAHTFITAKGTIPVLNTLQIANLKRKASNESILPNIPIKKKARLSFIPSQVCPVGIIWDSKNYSCAYDAIFTILCDVWIQNPKKWTTLFCWLSKPLERLAYNYREILRGQKRLEAARNDVRKMLHNSDNNLFPYGQIGTNVIELARKLMVRDQSPCIAKIQCTTCGKLDSIDPPENFMHLTDSSLKNINAWLQNWQKHNTVNCHQCNSQQHIIHSYPIPPEIMMFSLNVTGIAISKTVKLRGSNNKDTVLPLKGIVYSGNFHFTCRIVSDKNVWFHDGMTTKSTCQKEGHITDFTDKKLMMYNNTVAVLAIYAKK
jgi:Helitron helicase-like domain at N-terminus/PIF1-like helicase